MNYIGIDLGTTNSAICAYDGEAVRIFKSPEQHDVTPSAIFIDRRGNKYVGSRAYNNAARNPDNSATLFKRLIGTSTPIKLPAVDIELSPEECSAEILKVLFGYLPEEIRNDPDTATVITVPAAFNQMQKDATLTAANTAGIGRVALMQEPVAAVMSVMRSRKIDGTFLIFDLGGGTLDVAIADSTGGRVSLLAHGGVEMCGGRDFDRILFDNIVKPWLYKNFDLPDNLVGDPKFRSLVRMATRAAETAKIELSQRDDAVIILPETESGVRDLSGQEIFIDLPISRAEFDGLIGEKVSDAIAATRSALEKAGLSPHDVERIVFVGGPTQYKPLRDRVAFELGIAASTEVNPMTAVAEGAAIFAESLEWSSETRGRKSSRGSLSAGGSLGVAFNFLARTPTHKTKVVIKLNGSPAAGSEFQVDSLDTGWSSGRIRLIDGASVELALPKSGDNIFKVFVFDGSGGPIALQNDRITIVRTAATVDAIPASHSVGIEAKDKVGGRGVLAYLVQEGEQLPKKGKLTFKTEESLRSGSAAAIRFKIWEGEITDPITDNRFIGIFEVKGSDVTEGVVPAGADIDCEYAVDDSGNITLQVSIPSVGGTFSSGRNFYSRQEGQIDFSKAAKLVEDDANQAIQRLDQMSAKVDDARVDAVRRKLAKAANIDPNETDPETAKQAMDDVLEAKRVMAALRKTHLKTIRQIELDAVVSSHDQFVKQFARPAEASNFENLARTAQISIDRSTDDFEIHLDDLRSSNFRILWRQEWFVVDRFNWLADSSHLFPNASEFNRLVLAGREAIAANDTARLRNVVGVMDETRIGSGGVEDMVASANIIRK